MHDSHCGKWSNGRLAVGAAVAVLAMAGAARAEQIRYPKDKPIVTMNVPDGWAVDYTPTGVEMRSPEKNAVVIAGVVKGDKFSINVWSKSATERMIALGVAFEKAQTGETTIDPTKTGQTKTGQAKVGQAKAGQAKAGQAKTNTKAADTTLPAPKAPPAATAAAAAKPAPSAADATPPPSMLSQAPGAAPTNPSEIAALSTSKVQGSAMAPSFSMFGDPTASGPNMDTARAMSDLPSKGGSGGPNRINGLDFKVAQYSGTTMQGRPVDVQLVIIRLSDDEVFLVEQASDANDDRTVGIVTSTKSIL